VRSSAPPSFNVSVASETLVFHMIHADIKVPQELNDFLEEGNIRFRGAAIGNSLKKLRLEGIRITSAYDLQKVVPNPTTKTTPSLYDLANHTIGTNLEHKKKYNQKKKMDVAAQEK
jgi:hypothetical protein